MKYLPSRELESVTSALNFNTTHCQILGSCDLYTTKAAGTDKKLYKNIDKTLETQHESLKRLSESLSPPNAELFNLNLSRSSPFGPLGDISSRRTFAYLIATLNASHPDYDFSHFLRPSDFRNERSLKAVIQTVDATLQNLRPRPLSSAPFSSTAVQTTPQTPGGSQTWSPLMWKRIDTEMHLRECEIYRFAPQDDPFDSEESAIWSHHYFFFNKERRRVLYIHFRGLSLTVYTPTPTPTPKPVQTLKRPRPVSRSFSFSEVGALKRARFWLGDQADRCVSEPVWDEDDEEEVSATAEFGEDEADTAAYDEDAEAGFASDGDEIERRWKERSGVRAVSQEVAETLEV